MTRLLFINFWYYWRCRTGEEALTLSPAPISVLLLKTGYYSIRYRPCFLYPMCWWTPGRIPRRGCCEQWLQQWRLEYQYLFITDSISCARASSRDAGSSILHCLSCFHAGFHNGCVTSYPSSSFISFAHGLHLLLHFTNTERGLEPLRMQCYAIIARYASFKSKDSWFYGCNTMVTPGKLGSMGYSHLTAVYSSIFRGPKNAVCSIISWCRTTLDPVLCLMVLSRQSF